MPKNKRFVLNYAAWSLGFILLGLILLFAPNHGELFICYLLGVCAVVWGIVHVVWFFTKEGEARIFGSDIPLGVVFLILGVYLFSRPQAVYGWVPVLMGFAVVYDSVVKVQHAVQLKTESLRQWWWVLAAAMVTAILGLLLIVNVFDSSFLWFFFGAVMLVDGLVDLAVVGLVLFHKKVGGGKAAGDKTGAGDTGSVAAQTQPSAAALPATTKEKEDS